MANLYPYRKRHQGNHWFYQITSEDDVIVGGDLTVNGSFTFGDASTDVLAINGYQTFGVSGTPLTKTYTQKAQAVYTTCASTNASTSFEPVLFHTEMTGAGQVGGRVRAYMETDVALGAWANAFKGEIDFKTSGGVTGLGSAVLAEMTLAGGAMSAGTYGVLELELNCPEDWSGSVPVSFMHASFQGDTADNFDDYGYLLNIQGATIGSGHLVQENTAGDATHAIRIKIGATDYYLMATTVGA